MYSYCSEIVLVMYRYFTWKFRCTEVDLDYTEVDMYESCVSMYQNGHIPNWI